MTWQPIETAPRGGVAFLAFQPARKTNPEIWPALMGVGFFHDHGFSLDAVSGYDIEIELDSPTHWMPLPEPPRT